jgi:hypothetical protein
MHPAVHRVPLLLQVTVNNQIVIGTLMNICDDPNRVSIGANWRESDTIKRVPIIVTGNDFSTLYAPLIRDGRMEKFYWQPQREDVVNIVWQVGVVGGGRNAAVLWILQILELVLALLSALPTAVEPMSMARTVVPYICTKLRSSSA